MLRGHLRVMPKLNIQLTHTSSNYVKLLEPVRIIVNRKTLALT